MRREAIGNSRKRPVKIFWPHVGGSIPFLATTHILRTRSDTEWISRLFYLGIVKQCYGLSPGFGTKQERFLETRFARLIVTKTHAVIRVGASKERHDMAHKYLVTLTAGEDGYIVAECPALPGCVSQEKTREEALRNIQEAIEGIIEVRKAQNLPIPSPASSKLASPRRWPRFPSSRAVRQRKHLRKSASSSTAKREAT